MKNKIKDKVKELAATEFDHSKIWHNAVLFAVVFVLVLTCFFAVVDIDEAIEYPTDTLIGYDWWVQQFDAMEKGQLYIDIEPSKELCELENPYDPEQREGVYYLWDRAYFDGHYYSYFGIAPILTVYYPFYHMTGELPSASIACMFLAAGAMLFLGLAYREFVIRFARGANLWMTALTFVGVAFAAGIFIGLCWSDRYYVAVLSAIEWSMAFFYFAMRGLRAKYTAARAVLLVLSAIALTMTVCSRPTVALMCAAVIPLFFEYAIRGGKKGLRDKLISLSSFATVLACGAGLVMWYNAARFGSPFDFGSSYQLTVSDISQNKFDMGMLGDAIYHFFFQAPSPTNEFPFVGVSHVKPEYDRYFYYAKTVGAFAFGLPIGALFAPFATKIKKDPAKFCALSGGVLLSAFVAFFDYCYAGVDLRYLIDFLPMLSLIGAVVLLSAHKEAHGQESVRYKGIFTAVILILCVAAVCMTVGVTRMNPESHIFPIIE